MVDLNRREQIAVGVLVFLLIATMAIAIAALILAVQNPQSSSNRAFMARTNVAAQTLTGGVSTIVEWDTLEGTSYGFTYAAGKFTAEQSGWYTLVGNLAINVSGPSGGGGSTIGPLTAWVSKEGDPIHYGIGNYIPLDLSFVSGNSQYAQWSTMLQINDGESVAVNVLSATSQVILGGPSSYVAIGVPAVTSSC